MTAVTFDLLRRHYRPEIAACEERIMDDLERERLQVKAFRFTLVKAMQDAFDKAPACVLEDRVAKADALREARWFADRLVERRLADIARREAAATEDAHGTVADEIRDARE